jgi:Glycine-rich domain-containing protein-like
MSMNNCVFSCDLVANARKHIWFLRKVHASTGVSSPDCDVTTPRLMESLRRYQDLWLPLVAATSVMPASYCTGSSTTPPALLLIQLIPPPDIAWVWHCHRLAPKQYCDYCTDTFGHTIEANPPFTLVLPHGDTDTSDTESVIITRTEDLWNTRYPKENFYLLDLPTPRQTSIDVTHPLIGKFDVLGSMKRQATFLWQVSGERYTDDDFLEEGVANYAKFLHLRPKAMQQNIILVPTIQIDLMWHTHMLTSMECYNRDCIRIMNSILYHDDTYTDRSEGSVLDVAYTATKTLWKSVYGTEYVVPDGMYRGEPPTEYFSPQWDPDKNRFKPSIKKQCIGNVQALSTSPGPRDCPELSGTSSEASSTRILSSKQARQERKQLRQIEADISQVETDMHWANCCCRSSTLISKYEKKLDTLKKAKAVMLERFEIAPSGTTTSKNCIGLWLCLDVLCAACTAGQTLDGTDVAGQTLHGMNVHHGGGTYFVKANDESILITGTLFLTRDNCLHFSLCNSNQAYGGSGCGGGGGGCGGGSGCGGG